MSNPTDRSVGWALWPQWVLASVAGIALGIAVAMGIVLAVHTLVGGLTEDRVPAMLFLSIGIGLMQWLVLRRRLRGAGWWVLASIAGWTAGDALARWLCWLMRGTPGMAAGYGFGALVRALSIGSLLGILQWLVLRRQVSRSGWWEMANLAGLSAVSLAVGDSLRSLAEFVSFALVAPAVTGLVLLWLLRGSTPTVSGLEMSH